MQQNMEMEAVMAVPPPMDFNFDSNCSSPYITAPSSPQRFGNFFFSAPTSPTRTVSSFFHHNQLNNNNNNNNDDFHARHSSASYSAPEQSNNNDYNEDFEFNFSGQLERPSLSAEELFHGGKIKPLRLANNASSSEAKKNVQEALNRKDSMEKEAPQQQHKRGRGRKSSSSSVHKGNRRSLSPLRDSEDVSQKGSTRGVSSFPSNKQKTSASTTAAAASSYASFLSSISFTKGYRKWRFKDFLLFRSASEGRATDKDPLRKYAALSKTTAHEDVRNSSFRSAEGSGSVSRRRGPVSAHELHYTENRAASEELKKKTLLPYKQGLLGCLGFNPGVHHISRRIGSLERS